MNGMDEAQARINEAMRGPPDPGSPAALRSEIARLRKGIQDYLDGNYEHPRKHRPDLGECKHGIPWYSECACCDCDHFQHLLDGPSVSNGVRRSE